MRALSLTHQELTREALLKKAEQIPGAWIGIRIAAFLLILSGWKSTRVAELFGLTRWAVVKWMRRANREGLEAVNDRPRPGRPSQFDEEIMKDLDEALSKSPQDYGISRSRWDGIVVTEYLKRVHYIKIQVRHAQRLMKKLGYSLRRPVYRYVQATEAGVKEFHEKLKKLLLAQRSKDKRVVLFEDETGFSLHPKLGRVWGKKGAKSYVYTKSQHQKRLNLFGWVDPLNGLHGVMKWVRGDTDGFLKMLKRIVYRFKGRIIDLFVDNASWHKGPRVKQFLAKNPRLKLHYLPPYHPELNFQERLWRMMRYEETSNTYYETLIHLKVAVFSRSQRWKPHKLKQLCHLI